MSRLSLASRLLLAPLVALLLTLLVAPPSLARAWGPVEDYAPYQPQTRCHPKAKPGTVVLGDWMVEKYGGAFGGIARTCTASTAGTSEHYEGRAFDWTLDASRKADRQKAQAFLADVFAADGRGRADAKARRMGIMYVIWNDRTWSSWREFKAADYLSSSCPTVKKCSTTLRHRDHLHVSLTRAAARGETSWFDGRMN